jgi:hypothetical protein
MVRIRKEINSAKNTKEVLTIKKRDENDLNIEYEIDINKKDNEDF